MSRVKPYKTRRETLLDNKRMLDFMALASDKPPEEFHTRIPDPPKPRVKSDAITEADVNDAIREWVRKQERIALFRNNRGEVMLENGGRIRYGVGPQGASDWIGFKSITVTKDMVGTSLAVFCAIEAKRPGAKAREDQKQFLADIIRVGGIAGIAESADDLPHILGD